MTRHLRPRVPAPGEPLERNQCRYCAWAVVLLARVGWVHDTRSGLAVDCLFPAPAHPRCGACRGRFAADLLGAVVRHEVPGTGVACPGSRRVGVPPPTDAAAFSPTWPPGPGWLTST